MGQAPFPQGPLDISLFEGFPEKQELQSDWKLGEENLIFPPLKLSVILGHFLRVLNARLSSLNPKLVTSRHLIQNSEGDLLRQLGYKANSLSHTNSTMLNTLLHLKNIQKPILLYLLSTINYQLLSPKVLKPTRDSPFPTADVFSFFSTPP